MKTIVIIDDEPAICRTLKLLIEKSSSYSVVCCDDARKGLVLIRKLKPVAVVLDICMPRISGLELLKEIKEDQRTMHIPVIMLTGNDTSEFQKDSVYWFAEAYHTKPVTRDELMQSIERSVSSRVLS